MSRFESSRFVRNPQVMHVEILKSACDTLGWKYSVKVKDKTLHRPFRGRF